ncbi:hypothetical protein SLEP1_g787 [Rubroshorea leprosula]|uniref:Uncharacterized protein n=1 Tax=Rubroshorea leprosula TaxID=152421 RepID=A0AAV5HBQ1_9ROSI|nr:hypothetical protein SLEP1_g787 [Rubroshorea leprosula]
MDKFFKSSALSSLLLAFLALSTTSSRILLAEARVAHFFAMQGAKPEFEMKCLIHLWQNARNSSLSSPRSRYLENPLNEKDGEVFQECHALCPASGFPSFIKHLCVDTLSGGKGSSFSHFSAIKEALIPYHQSIVHRRSLNSKADSSSSSSNWRYKPT